MTMGEVHPHLKADPRLAWLAAEEYPFPPAGAKATGFDPDAHLATKLLILGCDYRGGPATECGCTKTVICLKGKGRPIPGTDATDVTSNDCLACVTG